jgi:hypothetical protein
MNIALCKKYRMILGTEIRQLEALQEKEKNQLKYCRRQEEIQRIQQEITEIQQVLLRVESERKIINAEIVIKIAIADAKNQILLPINAVRFYGE